MRVHFNLQQRCENFCFNVGQGRSGAIGTQVQTESLLCIMFSYGSLIWERGHNQKEFNKKSRWRCDESTINTNYNKNIGRFTNTQWEDTIARHRKTRGSNDGGAKHHQPLKNCIKKQDNTRDRVTISSVWTKNSD